MGLRDLLAKAITPAHFLNADSCGLVIGAGGTSRAALYALHAIGLRRLFLFNRTASSAVKTAEAMPADFNITPITSLDPSVFDVESPIAIICTVPGNATATRARPNEEAGVFLPDSLLDREMGGVVIDAAYKPRTTPLIALAEARGAGWTAIPGIMMLLGVRTAFTLPSCLSECSFSKRIISLKCGRVGK